MASDLQPPEPARSSGGQRSHSNSVRVDELNAEFGHINDRTDYLADDILILHRVSLPHVTSERKRRGYEKILRVAETSKAHRRHVQESEKSDCPLAESEVRLDAN